MVIVYKERWKVQRYLIIVFIFILLITTVVLWRGFFVKPKPIEFERMFPTKKVEIDFEVLKNPILKELQLPEEAPPPPEAGRENPFLPY